MTCVMGEFIYVILIECCSGQENRDHSRYFWRRDLIQEVRCCIKATKVALGRLDGAKGGVGGCYLFSGALLLLGPEGQDAPAMPRGGEAVGFCCCAAVLKAGGQEGDVAFSQPL